MAAVLEIEAELVGVVDALCAADPLGLSGFETVSVWLTRRLLGYASIGCDEWGRGRRL